MTLEESEIFWYFIFKHRQFKTPTTNSIFRNFIMTNQQFIAALSISLIFLLISGYDVKNSNAEEIITRIAKFVLYLTIIKHAEHLSAAFYDWLRTKNIEHILKVFHIQKANFAASTVAAAVLIATKNSLFNIDIVFIALASALVYNKTEMDQKQTTVSYGVGMACSFYEGYLAHVIPGDGENNLGISRNIEAFESAENVRFPVKRLFLIITKSLYCPPQLGEFNKENAERRGISCLEACLSLQDVKKDVAGVKSRIYRNSVYKIIRSRAPDVAPVAKSGVAESDVVGSGVAGVARPHVVAECASPLHTMHKVMDKRVLFEELQSADFDEIREDFCRMIKKIIETVPACRGKCELIYYDDTDPSQNLADIILERVQQLEPDFEKLLTKEQ